MKMIECVKGNLFIAGVRGTRHHEEPDRQGEPLEQSFFHNRFNTPCPDNGHRRNARPAASGRTGISDIPYIRIV